MFRFRTFTFDSAMVPRLAPASAPALNENSTVPAWLELVFESDILVRALWMLPTSAELIARETRVRLITDRPEASWVQTGHSRAAAAGEGCVDGCDVGERGVMTVAPLSLELPSVAVSLCRCRYRQLVFVLQAVDAVIATGVYTRLAMKLLPSAGRCLPSG